MSPQNPQKVEGAALPDGAGRTEAAAVANIVRRLHKPQTLTVAEVGELEAQLLLVPEGFKAQSVKGFLDEWLDAPRRREGTALVADLDSFVTHVLRFKDDHTAIFALRDETAPSLLAVLDYHCAGATGEPRFGRHRTKYDFPLADEWKAWRNSNKTPMGQAEFAAWIEEHLLDVVDPSGAGATAQQFATALGATFATPAKLLELSRGLDVRVGSAVRNAVKLDSGEAQIAFVEEHTDRAGAPLKVPGAFLIAIPVFRSGAAYQLAVRLRYRVKGSEISWFYELYRDQPTFDHAFDEACVTATSQTGCPVFQGRPE